MKRLKAGEFLDNIGSLPLLDVRSPGEYSAGHVPSAFSLPLFNDAMQSYLNRSFASALEAFQSIAETHPEDLTARFFLNNTHAYLQKGVPDDWTGVVEMTNK